MKTARRFEVGYFRKLSWFALAAALLCATTSGCGKRSNPSTSTEAGTSPLQIAELRSDLPLASNGRPIEPRDLDAPQIVVQGETILLGDQRIDSVQSVSPDHAKNLVALRNELKGRREDWKAKRPGQPFPGAARIQAGERESARVVKGVVRAVLAAGYPNVFLLTKKASGDGQSLLYVGPTPIAFGTHFDGTLFSVTVESESRAKIAWMRGTETTESRDAETGVSTSRAGEREITTFPKLAEAASAAWRERGVHRAASDRSFDKALLGISDELTYRHFVAAIDSLATPKRELELDGKTSTVPAFDVRLADRLD